ncbi:MAG: hypothetical protein CBC48_06360 [bacterium TMED88]|nr:hypothetical protein [Deltaproteobacteria bacterium]OUV34157.1 MAG: hypothetical protein CBC48_06360 [bacterium TMED88]
MSVSAQGPITPRYVKQERGGIRPNPRLGCRHCAHPEGPGENVRPAARVDLGVGTGWARLDYHALGRGHLFEERGAVTDESLEVMLKCWEGGEFGWEGKFFQFRTFSSSPSRWVENIQAAFLHNVRVWSSC